MPPMTIVRIWSARYRGASLPICEDLRHISWIAADEVRALLPGLRPDVSLQAWHRDGLAGLDQSRRWFFDEHALARELKRIASHDALMLLAWLERTILVPGERRRASTGHPGGGTGAIASAGSSRGRRADPVPEVDDPHMAGVSLPTDHQQGPARPLRRLWLGRLSLGRTFAAGGASLLVAVGLIVLLMRDWREPDNYQRDYLLRQWMAVTLLLALLALWIWWCVGLMRSALRRQRRGGGFIGSLLAFYSAGSLLLLMAATTLPLAGEWLLGWWLNLTDRDRVVQVKLIQLESPGGFVIEGLAMARLIEHAAMDTVSFEDCHSSCTLLFAAGQKRLLGPQMEMGFHRS